MFDGSISQIKQFRMPLTTIRIRSRRLNLFRGWVFNFAGSNEPFSAIRDGGGSFESDTNAAKLYENKGKSFNKDYV